MYNRDGNRARPTRACRSGCWRAGSAWRARCRGCSGSYSLNARRSTLEPLLAVLREQLDEDGIPESFYFYDLNGKVSVDLSPNDRVSLATYAGRDQVVVPFGDDAQFDLDYGNRTASLAYNRVLSGTAFAQTRLTASRYFSYPDRVVRRDRVRAAQHAHRLLGARRRRVAAERAVRAADGRLGRDAGPGAGEQLQRQHPDRRTTTRRATPRATSRAGSGRATAWILTGGLRAEYFRSLTDDLLDAVDPVRSSYVRLSPQVQVERTFGEDVVVQARGRAVPPVPVAHLERGVLGLRHLGHDGRRRAAPGVGAGRAGRQDEPRPGLPARRRGLRPDAARPVRHSTRGPGRGRAGLPATCSGSGRATPTAPRSCSSAASAS